MDAITGRGRAPRRRAVDGGRWGGAAVATAEPFAGENAPPPPRYYHHYSSSSSSYYPAHYRLHLLVTTVPCVQGGHTAPTRRAEDGRRSATARPSCGGGEPMAGVIRLHAGDLLRWVFLCGGLAHRLHSRAACSDAKRAVVAVLLQGSLLVRGKRGGGGGYPTTTPQTRLAVPLEGK